MQWLCTPPVRYSPQFENNQIITKTNIYNKKYNCSKGQFILTLSLRDDHSVVVQLVLARSKLVKQKLVPPQKKKRRWVSLLQCFIFYLSPKFCFCRLSDVKLANKSVTSSTCKKTTELCKSWWEKKHKSKIHIKVLLRCPNIMRPSE